MTKDHVSDVDFYVLGGVVLDSFGHFSAACLCFGLAAICMVGRYLEYRRKP